MQHLKTTNKKRKSHIYFPSSNKMRSCKWIVVSASNIFASFRNRVGSSNQSLTISKRRMQVKYLFCRKSQLTSPPLNNRVPSAIRSIFLEIFLSKYMCCKELLCIKPLILIDFKPCTKGVGGKPCSGLIKRGCHERVFFYRDFPYLVGFVR